MKTDLALHIGDDDVFRRPGGRPIYLHPVLRGRRENVQQRTCEGFIYGHVRHCVYRHGIHGKIVKSKQSHAFFVDNPVGRLAGMRQIGNVWSGVEAVAEFKKNGVSTQKTACDGGRTALQPEVCPGRSQLNQAVCIFHGNGDSARVVHPGFLRIGRERASSATMAVSAKSSRTETPTMR